MGAAVFKSADVEQRVVFAEVYAPMRPDSDKEYMDAEGIRKMAYDFVQNGGLHQIDSNHNNRLVEGAYVVESFIARKGDPVFIEGAWVVGVHIPGDDDWAKVLKGEWNGFSMEANVFKEQVEVEVSIPNQLKGTTHAEAGHTHTFTVSYSEDGTFMGGITDVVDGHSHIIRRGTITEEVAGHKHRFSHVESLLITKETPNAS